MDEIDSKALDNDLYYLLACVEQHANKFPVPSRMRNMVARIRASSLTSKLAALEDENKTLRDIATAIFAAIDAGRLVERGAGGMTIESQMKRSVYNGVPAWPIEENREAFAALSKPAALPAEGLGGDTVNEVVAENAQFYREWLYGPGHPLAALPAEGKGEIPSGYGEFTPISVRASTSTPPAPQPVGKVLGYVNIYREYDEDGAEYFQVGSLELHDQPWPELGEHVDDFVGAAVVTLLPDSPSPAAQEDGAIRTLTGGNNGR